MGQFIVGDLDDRIPDVAGARERAERISRSLEGRPHSDSATLIREDRDRPASEEPMRYLDRVYLVFEGRQVADPSEVADVAARLGLTFPDGYREYVTELGAGMLSGTIRIWPPEQVERQLPGHRQRLATHFFWDEDGPLSPGRARETVALGDTMDGDDLVFHPDRPDVLFWLPRHDDRVHEVGPGLDAAIDWYCDSGVLTRSMTCRYFEPNGERERVGRSIPLTFQEVRDALVELGVHDHVAWEERAGDEEKVFEVMVKTDDGFEEVEGEDEAIMLLVKEFGGDVTASWGIGDEPGTTDVTVDYVASLGWSPKLARLLSLLDELEEQGG